MNPLWDGGFPITCKECVLNLSQGLPACAKFCSSNIEVYNLPSCPQRRTGHSVTLKQVKGEQSKADSEIGSQ